MANKTTNAKKSSSSKKKTPAKKKKNASYSRKTSASNGKKAGFEKKHIFTVIISVLVIGAIVAAGVLSSGSSGKKQNGIKNISKEIAWGVDVSSHNGKINWKKVSKKADFAFVRVGYRGYANGKIEADKRAKTNITGATKHGIPVGVYFYSQAVNESEAEKEADFVLKKIKGLNITLPVVIDFEYAYHKGKMTGRLYRADLSRKEKTALINAFCEKIRNAGYTPGVYASSYIYRSHLIMKNIPDDVFIWVADYNGKVTYGGYYDIWQYSEKGKCPGISSKHVDTNYFYTKKRL